jgi:hypothetical protein
MKKFYTLFTCSLFTAFLMAQNPVPNPGFESWIGPQPENWFNSTAITQSTDKHSGTYAAKGEKTNGGSDPQLSAGSGNGFSVNSRYTYINFYYKFNKVGNESIEVSLYMDNPSFTIGQASATISTATSVYKAFSAQISYTGSGNPTDCTVDILINNAPVGSYFIIDDVSLSTSPLGVEEVQKDVPVLDVYPNPASSFLKINFPGGFQTENATIDITNILGQQLKQAPLSALSSIDISDLANGNYIVALKSDEMILTRKIQVVK